VLFRSNVAQAKVEVVQFDDPSQQTLYKRLIDELRCLVCQNQNLADSNADLAIDLRKKVRVLINDGKTYDDVVEFMVSRYGEFVMYRPYFSVAISCSFAHFRVFYCNLAKAIFISRLYYRQ